MVLLEDAKSKHRSAYRVRLSMVEGTGLTGLGVAARPLLPRVRVDRLRRRAHVSRMAAAVGRQWPITVGCPMGQDSSTS
jgi:hypothetical protein